MAVVAAPGLPATFNLGAPPTPAGRGRATYSVSAAEEILVGYCLAPDPARLHCGKWAYHLYDCTPSIPQTPFAISDFLAPTLLDATVTAPELQTILGLEPQLSQDLLRISPGTCFWDIPAGVVAGSTGIYSQLDKLYRAVQAGAGWGTAKPHKMLHHKRPHQFPLVDGRTKDYLPPKAWWATIHGDLTRDADVYEHLESYINNLLATYKRTVAITRLRIHDILLWAWADNQYIALQAAGAAVIGGGTTWAEI